MNNQEKEIPTEEEQLEYEKKQHNEWLEYRKECDKMINEIKGLLLEDAKKHIEKNYPTYYIKLVEQNHLLTCDMVKNRIRLYLSEDKKTVINVSVYN